MRFFSVALLGVMAGGAVLLSSYLQSDQQVHAQTASSGLLGWIGGVVHTDVQHIPTDVQHIPTGTDHVIPSLSSLKKKVTNSLDTTVNTVTKTIKTKSEQLLSSATSDDETPFSCKEIHFVDISGHVFSSDVIFLAHYCMVKGTIKQQHFYPDNYLRRDAVLTMLVNAYGDMVTYHQLDSGAVIDTQFSRRLQQIVRLAYQMGIVDLLVGSHDKDMKLDTFVTHADVRLLMSYLHTRNDNISLEGLSILGFDQHIITRAEMAHVIAQSFDHTDLVLSSKQGTIGADELKHQVSNLGIETLLERNIVQKNSYIVQHSQSPITREMFLELLVRAHHGYNPAVPLQVPAVDYFIDVEEGTGMSILTQAKNLGLTYFLEETVKGKKYLHPTKFVTQYEVSKILNQLGLYTFDEQLEDDEVLVKGEKAAKMIVLAYGWKKDYDFKNKMKLGDVVQTVRNIIVP